MTVLVTGVRGDIGAGVLAGLRAAGREVRAASRSKEAGTSLDNTFLDLRDVATFPAALDGVTEVFLYAEPSTIEAFLNESAVAGVQRVVVLSSDSVVHCDPATNALARHHAVVEEAVRAAPVTSLILRPGGFASMALGWADAIRAGQSVLQPLPDTRLDVIDPRDIADVAVHGFMSTELDDRTVTLGGPEVLSFREQLAVIAELVGHDIDMHAPSPERAADVLSQHIPPNLVQSVIDYWATLPVLGSAERTATTWTRRPARTFRNWCIDHVASFR